MNPFSSSLFRVATMALALPILGMSAAIEINNVCYSSSCPGTSLTSGGVSGSSSNSVTVNGDPFTVTSTYSSSYAGPSLVFDPVVTYTGTGLSRPDTVTVDFYQAYTTPAGSFAGTYFEHIPLSVPANTTVSADLIINGAGIGVVNANGPGLYDFYETAYEAVPGTSFLFDYQFVFTFDGAAPGSTASSTPEPVETIPAALSLIGFGLVALRRRKK